MAESTSVALESSVPDEDLQRAEKFTLEAFVHEGEERDEVLAPGTARRRALDDALAELDAGREEPSVEWRREYALMLGLERLLSDDEQLAEQPEDPGASRRFWFEHATGAGKTVAAMGFVEASRTGGILILTHR